MVAAMVRTFAFFVPPLGLLRTAIVGGCALALILADRALPLLSG